MPLNGIEDIRSRENPTDEVFHPWAETMPAPDPTDETMHVRPSRRRGFAFVAVAVSFAGLVVYAKRKLFRR